MARFTYSAIDSRGTEKSGSLDALDAKQAVASLRAQGFFPTEVAAAQASAAKPGKSPAPASAAGVKTAPPKPVVAKAKPAAKGTGLNRPINLSFGSGVSAKELSGFTRQLSTLLRAGMPLLRGLEVLARQERNPAFRAVTIGLAEAIQSGGTLSEAMAQRPKVFDRLYINMVKAGEASGVLDVVLDRLARFQEKSLQLKGKITAAMFYPIIVMSVAVVILVGLLVFVVPKFKQIFADLLKGAPLPTLTQAVLTVSDAVKNHYLLVIAIAVVGFFALKIFARTPGGARFIDSATVKIPLFGPLFLKGIVARFGRTLGTLLSSGVPILQALLITRDTCGNTRVADAITAVHDRVKEGAPVAQPLEATGVFPPMVTSMIDVGEHTGQLPDMLNKVADIYEDEVDTAVAGLSSLIEPILILFLAVVVGTIVIALFLPIIRIVQLLT